MSASKNSSEADEPVDVPSSLVDLLGASVRRHGPRTLFLTKVGRRWLETSYDEFGRSVENLRGGLAALGVDTGDRVGIIAGNRVEWAAIAYATYQLGAVLVPMYESQLSGDWAFIARDAGVKILFVSTPAIYERLAHLPREMLLLRHLILIEGAGSGAELTFGAVLKRGARRPVPCRSPAPDDIACLMYTSGTTGEPKGVILTHGNVMSNVLTLRDILPVSPHHRTLSFLPWAHAFGHTAELHMVVSCGASMAIAESVDKLIKNLAEVKPTVLIAVPRVFIRVHAGLQQGLATKPRPIRWLARRGMLAARKLEAGEALSRGERALWWIADRLIFAKVRRRLGGQLQFAVSGAAALPKEVAELIDCLGIKVYEGYGLTETSPVVCANIPGQRKLGSVGRPLPGVRVAVDTSVTGGGRDGEIVVTGPNVTRGYYNRAEETRAALTDDGALRTGDVGYLDADGYLYVTGRIKEQYKLANGKYVSPAPLEERLKLTPFIADLMIYGDNQLYNIALVVPDPDVVRTWAAATPSCAGQTPSALLRHPQVLRQFAAEIDRCSTSFRGYERIGAFALLPEPFTEGNGLLTPSMKMKRRKIVERWRAEIDRLYDSGGGGDAERGIWIRPGISTTVTALE